MKPAKITIEFDEGLNGSVKGDNIGLCHILMAIFYLKQHLQEGEFKEHDSL